MKKGTTLYIQGIFIILTGVLLMVAHNETLGFVYYLLISLLIPSALFGLLTMLQRISSQVQFAYQEVHAFVLILFISSMFIYVTDFDRLNESLTFLFIFYGFSEIIFCNWLFNLPGKIDLRILAGRVGLGLFSGVSAVVIQSSLSINENLKLIGFGLLFISVGANILLYKPIMEEEVK